ncbi:Ribosome assembly protein 1 [Sphaceloma murrayae]|uniref:Ribosome assembly protein 1 n=1 Tax=Sphaceloma murrayae TaxID=2082308 RepID=A0A2K1QN26_9PEZI|nr:Ribosome assembly protein 1 [Sphaceloma murrayae]
MAEPQPSNVKEGDTTQSVPAGGDDKKAAAALSSLDQPSVSDDGASKKDVDTKALGDAMQRLEVASGKADQTQDAGKTEKKEEEPAKKIKIEAADVTAVVEHCDMNKSKATELLRSYEGDLGKALRGYIGVGA